LLVLSKSWGLLMASELALGLSLVVLLSTVATKALS
jgi:hypothetical protein